MADSKKIIYEYEIEAVDHQDVVLPLGAMILSVMERTQRLVLFAMVDPLQPVEPYPVFIHATGEAIHEEAFRFINSVQLSPSAVVLHVFGGLPPTIKKQLQQRQVDMEKASRAGNSGLWLPGREGAKH